MEITVPDLVNMQRAYTGAEKQIPGYIRLRYGTATIYLRKITYKIKRVDNVRVNDPKERRAIVIFEVHKGKIVGIFVRCITPKNHPHVSSPFNLRPKDLMGERLPNHLEVGSLCIGSFDMSAVNKLHKTRGLDGVLELVKYMLEHVHSDNWYANRSCRQMREMKNEAQNQ